MNSGEILKLLAERHSKDIFIDECKNGATWTNAHSRIDAWTMKRSWAHPCITGYEIKISKSDFHGDTKYVNYFPMCNELYFVCPWNMISVSEIPLEVGLIFVSKTGNRLMIKKGAVHRKIDPPVNTLLYILMSRVKIKDETDGSYQKEYWSNWVKNRSEELDTGHIASHRLKKIVRSKIFDVTDENNKLKQINKELEDKQKNCKLAMDMLSDAGITELSLKSEYGTKYKVENIIKSFNEKIPYDFKYAVKALNDATKRLIEIMGEKHDDNANVNKRGI